MNSNQSITKNLPYTTAQNLSKFCYKTISTKSVLRNMHNLKPEIYIKSFK